LTTAKQFVCVLLQCPVVSPVQPTSTQTTDQASVCGNTNFPLSSCISLPQSFQHLNQPTITLAEAITIENNTRQQANCPEWFQHRRTRITSSTFGRIMKRKKEINDAFLKTIFQDPDNSFTSHPTTYGKTHEQNAKTAYTKHPIGCHSHLHDCGLIINPEFSFLGATPDAKVCKNGETGILEVKCLFAARNLTIPEAVAEYGSNADFCLAALPDSSEIKLKETHQYYYQIQGQLMISGAPFCDFVVHTMKDTHVETVHSNPAVMQLMITKLANIYQHHRLPEP